MPSQLLLKDVAQALDRRALSSRRNDAILSGFSSTPAPLQWDNVGLLVGDPSARVTRALVAGDLTSDILEACIREQRTLAVVHHPLIFPRQKGLAQIRRGGQGGGGAEDLVFRAIQAGVAVYATHSNFDQWALEVPQAVCRGLGMRPVGRLWDADEAAAGYLKLVTYVPEEHLEPVRSALFNVGAGHIGAYDECSFSTPGRGTFRGTDQTQPFVGHPGQREQVAEQRLEVILSRGLAARIEEALLAAHPYEEVAYEFQPLFRRPMKLEGLLPGVGFGVVGEFDAPISLEALTLRVKSTWSAVSTRVSGGWWTPAPGQEAKKIRRVGFAAGKTSSMWESVIQMQCDLWITGEVGFHTARVAASRGVSVLELGHRESEAFFAPTVVQWLEDLGVEARAESSLPQRWQSFE